MQNCKLNPITQENVSKREKEKQQIAIICIEWRNFAYTYKK